MTEDNKKISIVTPCYNAEGYIEETARSVLFNSAVLNKKVKLEYIVCDGGSTDNTLKVVENVFLEVNSDIVDTKILSKKDNGMYHALSKGLKIASGDIIAYINAGDFYSPYAFEIVSSLFHDYKIKWLTGLDISYNSSSQIIFSRLPFRYRRRFVRCGFHNNDILPHIQQESTFWDSDLNQLIDYDTLKNLKYAGDFCLWKTFSGSEDLYIVESWLGGFKYHPEQLSSRMDLYREEFKSLSDKSIWKERVQAYFEMYFWKLSGYYKKKYNKKTIIFYDHNYHQFVLPGSPVRKRQ